MKFIDMAVSSTKTTGQMMSLAVERFQMCIDHQPAVVNLVRIRHNKYLSM